MQHDLFESKHWGTLFMDNSSLGGGYCFVTIIDLMPEHAFVFCVWYVQGEESELEQVEHELGASNKSGASLKVCCRLRTHTIRIQAAALIIMRQEHAAFGPQLTQSAAVFRLLLVAQSALRSMLHMKSTAASPLLSSSLACIPTAAYVTFSMCMLYGAGHGQEQVQPPGSAGWHLLFTDFSQSFHTHVPSGVGRPLTNSNHRVRMGAYIRMCRCGSGCVSVCMGGWGRP